MNGSSGLVPTITRSLMTLALLLGIAAVAAFQSTASAPPALHVFEPPGTTPAAIDYRAIEPALAQLSGKWHEENGIAASGERLLSQAMRELHAQNLSLPLPQSVQAMLNRSFVRPGPPITDLLMCYSAYQKASARQHAHASGAAALDQRAILDRTTAIQIQCFGERTARQLFEDYFTMLATLPSDSAAAPATSSTAIFATACNIPACTSLRTHAAPPID